MKKTFRNSLLILMSLMLVISCFIVSVTAANNGVISVESATAQAGEYVDVDITVSSNPGIAGMTLDVIFDSSVLTLIGVTDGGILGVNTHKPELYSPYTLSWSNDTTTQNFTVNGVIATLRFLVSDNVASGDYPVTIVYDYGNYDIYNVEIMPVLFNVESGYIQISSSASNNAPTTPPTVLQYVIGDADGDDNVTILDATTIQRKLVGYLVPNSFNEKAACVIGSELSILDATVIQRYLAGFINTHHVSEYVNYIISSTI